MIGSQLKIAGRGTADLMVPGEFQLTQEDFRRIAAAIYKDAGIYLPEAKATLVYARLAKRLRALGMTSFRQYSDLVCAPNGGEERMEMLAALTTNVTRFFREPHHFDHLKTQVLPPLLKQAGRRARVRVWSAACSSGQEPYSIALTILSLMPDAAAHDIKILATDIDPYMIAKGRRGEYAAETLVDVPADLRTKFFRPIRADGETSWRVADELQVLVTFRPLNLIAPWPMQGAFHAIFCRNVVIYFDEPTQQDIWSNFLPKLEPGGTLYLGHSERVTGPASASLRSVGVSTYSRISGERP